MKRYIIPLALIFFVSFSVQAQRTDLKGPAAKNYKPWKDKRSSNVEFVTVEVERKKGPEAKNAKVWSVDRKEASTLAVNSNTTRKTLKGPAAKNYKPWADNDSTSRLANKE